MAKKTTGAKAPKKTAAPKAPKAPKASKPAKAPKTPKAENPRARKGGNKVELSADQQRQSFLTHNTQIIALRAKLKIAKDHLDEAFDDAKSVGFKKLHFDVARDLSGPPKSEKKVESDVTTRLLVARWIGHKLGAQMDLFNEPDRTPIVDRAYDAGKQASMEGKARKPEHDASTAAYRAWIAGFDDHQRQLMGGFKAASRPDQVENRVAGLSDDGPDVGDDDDDDFEDDDEADGQPEPQFVTDDFNDDD